MYHYVRDIKNSDYPNIKGLEFEGFKRQLDYLSKNYNFVTTQDIVNHVVYGEPIIERSCLLSFDDGYKDHITYVLPELLKRKIHGSFFPPVRPVTQRELLDVNRVHFILESATDIYKLSNDLDCLCLENGITSAELEAFRSAYALPNRFDSGDVIYVKRMLQHALPVELRNLISINLFKKYVGIDEFDFAENLYISTSDAKILVDSGMYVGSHGNRHLWLNREPIESQRSDIDASLDFLQSIGAPTKDWVMCYPYGGYNDDTLKVLRERSCALGLTTQVGIADLISGSALELPRYDTNDFPQ